MTKADKKKIFNFAKLKKKPNFLGLIALVLFLYISVLPSLLPRPWWIQAIVSAVACVVGYGIGVGFSALIRWFFQYEFSDKIKRISWLISYIALPISIVITIIFGIIWQNQIRVMLNEEKIAFLYILKAGLLGTILFWIILWISRSIRKLTRTIIRLLTKKIPIRFSAAIGILLVIFMVYYTISGLFISNFYKIADRSFGTRDNTAPPQIVQPTSPLRSGSPESLIPWSKIGYQGRGFVGSGPSAKQIEEFNGHSALEPIRIYAGLQSAKDSQGRAQLAVDELNRTGAFKRKVLVIATATGTGWLDPKAVDALEFMYNGDTAIVSQQYSYLPSWISFLVDQQRAREAGRDLYDAIIEQWSSLPQGTRPKLLVYGLSLGSFGGQEAFSGINDIRRSVDGALYTGTPNTAEIWRSTTDDRDKGSLEWQPVYRKGHSVRFASSRDDIIDNTKIWDDKTRILFVQHANDPVVWFSFDLIFHQPDWLKEERAPYVSKNTRWFPGVTFLQIGLDQAIAASAPIGHGHWYIDTSVYSWAALYEPENWSIEKADKLQNYIDHDFVSDFKKSH